MKIPNLNSKDLLTAADFSKEEIINLFLFTLKLKNDHKRGKDHPYLDKKSLAMIFEKSSTRTRVSFETGITQLGGHALFLSPEDIQIGRGETIEDTARVLSRYVDGIMIRTNDHKKVNTLAENASIAVINGLSDSYHPCQALADLFTIFERNDDLINTKLAYIGDGNNVANSLLLCSAILGVHISIASPKNYAPRHDIVEQALLLAKVSGSHIEITNNIDMAVNGADYMYTDVWTSMGQEKEAAKRKKIFAKYKITKKLLGKTGKDCKVMHCLPAKRGQEIDDDVILSNQSIIFDQAENRLHAQKAVMCALMSKKYDAGIDEKRSIL